jgi:hypothetical protein
VIDRVTVTGADNSVKPEDLIPLTEEFPFVEWGILASQRGTVEHYGTKRSPPLPWLARLRELHSQGKFPQLSLHLCGAWVRQLLLGNLVVPPVLLPGFRRIQLNFHAEGAKCDVEKFAKALADPLFAGRDFIFQLDGASGNEYLEAVLGEDVLGCYGLFDVSGGRGILPTAWPKPQMIDVVPGEHGEGEEYHAYTGYAGGLGPDNLAAEIPKILAAAAGDEHTHEGRIWLDMETLVRSDDDQQFDLEKVRRCLEIAAPYVVRPNDATS